ncbi:MAG: NOB1 family endonuclease [Halobacteria archaeon]
MYVLDASVFIEEYDVDGDVATVPGVREELEGASQYRYDAMEGSGMRVEIPDSETREKVERAARKSGEFDGLGRKDLYLIGVATELDARLVTDDTGIETVATDMGVEVELMKESQEETVDWSYECMGCGRTYDEEVRCQVCGSETTKKETG